MKSGFDISKITGDARKGIKDAAKSVSEAASHTVDVAGNAASKAAEGAGDLAGRVGQTATDAFNAAGQTVNNTVQKAQDAAGARKAQEKAELAECRDIVLACLEQSVALDMIGLLGESPLYLDASNIKKIKSKFPVPREQTVLWADAEFDLRPSGIAVTERGVFVKSDVGIFDHMDKNAANGGKSMLSYYRWEDFEAAWFVGEDESNTAMCVAEECRGAFLEACKVLAQRNEQTQLAMLDMQQGIYASDEAQYAFEHGVSTAAMTPIAKEAKYAHNHASIYNPAGHGEMVENAHNMLDRLHGKHVIWKGTDNVKGGADRIVGGTAIQTKYYKTWRGSLDAAFDPNTGNYIYKDMQLEVPKDQYDKIVEGFRKKIEAGKVEGVSDPAQAELIVRKGKLTYQQAVNLTKPGTVESLLYDAGTGVVICSCAFGITFVATLYETYRKTSNIEESIQAGIVAGTQVFGTTFVQHVLSSQLSRTGLADALIAPSQVIVQKMGYKATQAIVNGLRMIGGKAPIYGAAASKQLAKVLRGNAITAAVTMVVFSAPETYKLATNKISGSQFTKNIGALTGSVAGGAAGAVAAGAAAGKVGAMVGTGVAGPVGTAVGIVGGFVGGTAGSMAVNTAAGILVEDDAETMGRLFNAMVAVLACEYMVDESEMSAVVECLNRIGDKPLKNLFEELRCADKQEETIRQFLEPIFDEVVSKRPSFELPGAKEIETAIEELAEEDQLTD